VSAKPKMGRPPYQPTDKERAQARALAAMGVPHTDIAIVLQISAPTLRLHFRQELDVGSIEANAKVAQALFRQATDATKPSVIAQIFWLKVRAGWSENAARGDEPPPRDEIPGKKEAATRAARTAQAGTGWENLLPGGNPRVQ
jgi:hypothetical protein